MIKPSLEQLETRDCPSVSSLLEAWRSQLARQIAALPPTAQIRERHVLVDMQYRIVHDQFWLAIKDGLQAEIAVEQKMLAIQRRQP